MPRPTETALDTNAPVTIQVKGPMRARRQMDHTAPLAGGDLFEMAGEPVSGTMRMQAAVVAATKMACKRRFQRKLTRWSTKAPITGPKPGPPKAARAYQIM